MRYNVFIVTGRIVTIIYTVYSKIGDFFVKIAEKLMLDIEVTDDEYRFLLWNTLIQLSSYCDDVDTLEEESFNIEQMLVTLDDQLGVTP